MGTSPVGMSEDRSESSSACQPFVWVCHSPSSGEDGSGRTVVSHWTTSLGLCLTSDVNPCP